MGREKGLLCWSLVLWLSLLLMDGALSSEVDNRSCTSSCGIITNISHPFRLPQDPPHCGDSSYELACKNNVPLLHLVGVDLNNGTNRVLGTYRVLGIDYNNYRIRIVDAGIQEGNCSSLPLSSLSLYNFNSDEYPYEYYEYNSDYSQRNLFEQVAYLNCSDVVREDTAYVDADPCVNWDSNGGVHLYAVAGDLLAYQFQPQCRLKLVTPMASDWESMVPGGRIKSYSDIHAVVSSGFELSWWSQACADLGCKTGCYFIRETQALECMKHQWLSYVLDYIYGILYGLFKIVGLVNSSSSSTYNHFSRSNIASPLGMVTGRFVLPFITARFLAGLVFLSTLLIYTCRRRHLSMYENIEDFIRLQNLLPLRYSYKDLKSITQGFQTKLGEGGFGTVYKGKLKSGLDVAVKMLGNTKANGQEFINEVATIGRIHHFNVVHLVGFCVEGTKSALVYEFMPNGSLEKHIFSKKKSVPLSYHKIYEISLGVAHGIAYLHHGCDMQILHFDIKPHNILLDDNFAPKISDFGLAKLYSTENSIVTLTAARGTIGYMAPELFYNNIGRVSYKADIYSFGMLLMEMASRRRNLNPLTENSSQLYFPLWIYDQFDEEKDIEMEDLTKEENDLAKKMFIVALWCIQLKPVDRPSMNKVVEMLEADDVSSLEMPPKPSLYPDERVLVDEGSISHTTSFISIRSQSSSGEGTSSGK